MGDQRRPRKMVHKQGQLARIGELFISSLLHYRGPKVGIVQAMESLFHVDTRFIFICEVTTPFLLGGTDFDLGRRVFIRHDTTTPNLYEVSPMDDADTVHRITKSNWIAIKRSLKVTDKNTYGVEKVFGNI